MARSKHLETSTKSNNGALITGLILVSLIVLGIVYCLPLFAVDGIHKVDDTTFHVGRLVGLSNVFTSPVNFNSFGNNGLMVNIFYPWLTMYPMFILYKLTGSYVLGYKLYYVLLSVVTLLISYWSMLGITKNKAAAYAFAIVYSFSSYRFADVFNRAALGESIALAFLPLVLLGIYKVCFENYKEWGKLAAGMTLLAYSHMLSLVMATAFTGILFLIAIITQDSRGQRFVAMVKAACLSLALSAAMIVPMAEQMIKNDLFTPSGDGGTMSKSAYSLVEIIKFTIINNPAGRGVGMMSLLAFVIAIILLIRSAVVNKKLSVDDRFVIWLLLIGAAMFVGTSDLLPWHYLGNNTPLATIQFVWRMNAYPTLAFAAAFSILVSKAMNSSSKNAIILLTVLTLICAGVQYCGLYVRNAEIVSNDYIQEVDVATWASGNVDYTPYQAWEFREDHADNMQFMYIDGKEIPKSPEISRSGTYYTQDLGSSNKDRKADIPVFKFYGEKVTLNGEPAQSELSERGTTELKVPASEDAVITISYDYTMLARASWIFSVVIFILSIIAAIRSRAGKSKA